MRHLVLILAIVLLPLRGWLGGGMAMAAVPVPVQSGHIVVAVHPAVAQEHGALSAPDVMAETTMTDDTGSDAGAHPCAEAMPDGAAHHASGGSHDHCNACQLCHSAVLNAVAPVAHTFEVDRTALRAPRADFVSAEAARPSKPPIS